MISPQIHLNDAADARETRGRIRAALVQMLPIIAIAIVVAELAHIAADTLQALPDLAAQAVERGALK